METRKVEVKIQELPEQKKVKLVEIKGVLDVLTVAHVERELNPLIEEGNYILIDCSKLSYMNTTGLVLLMKYQIKARRRNGAFKIISPSKNIYEIMDISGALKFLDVYETQKEALDSLN